MSEVKAKKFDLKFEGSKLMILVDPNADGEALLKVELDLAEAPDEVMALFAKKDDK